MRMILAGGAAALLAGCTVNDEDPQAGARIADPKVPLIAADGSPRGFARIIQVHGGVSVNVEGENLPPGIHGAHVHSVGRCDAPDFASAGPHWNPAGRQHGRENPAGPHLGDVPNLTVGADGRGSLEFEIPNAWVRANEPRILDLDGAAFVIHANADDNRTDPSGNSGGRIACAVLR
jgi:Cu-Zn family superoxide dismutase